MIEILTASGNRLLVGAVKRRSEHERCKMNALASLSNTAGKSASNINSLSISSIFEIAIPFLGVLNPAKTVEKLMSQ